jgi:hypothetical protein
MIKGILLSGKMLSGKDQVANHIENIVLDRTIVKIPWAYALKNEVASALALIGRNVAINDIDKNKGLYRPLLQAWAAINRYFDPDHYVKEGLNMMLAAATVAQIEGKPPVLFINTDTRYPNELVVRKDKFIAIRLVVSRKKQIERGKKLYGRISVDALNHPSETALDMIEQGKLDPRYPDAAFDYIIDSDRSLPEVYKDIDNILAQNGLSIKLF